MSRHQFTYEVELYKEVDVERAVDVGAHALEEEAGVIISKGQTSLSMPHRVIGVDTETKEPFDVTIPAESVDEARDAINNAEDNRIVATVTPVLEKGAQEGFETERTT